MDDKHYKTRDLTEAATTLHAHWVMEWAGAEFIDSLHQSHCHASADKTAKRWKNSPHVSEESRSILPDT